MSTSSEKYRKVFIKIYNSLTPIQKEKFKKEIVEVEQVSWEEIEKILNKTSN